MGNPPPTLDYAVSGPRSRARTWRRRLALAGLIVGCLYATLIAWLYLGWWSEGPAREMVGRVGGTIRNTTPAGPSWLGDIMPGRWAWMRERITELDLYRRPVTDGDLAPVWPLSRLEVLSLCGTRITDAGLVHLKGLHELQALSLVDTPITDPGLAQLRDLRALEVLMLAGTKVTDAGLGQLEDFPSLRTLYLDNTRITDVGVRQLAGLAKLRNLYLNDTQVTDAAVADLQTALPKCTIIRTGSITIAPRTAISGATRRGAGGPPLPMRVFNVGAPFLLAAALVLGGSRWRYRYHAAVLCGAAYGALLVWATGEVCSGLGMAPFFLIIAAVGEIIRGVGGAIVGVVRRWRRA